MPQCRKWTVIKEEIQPLLLASTFMHVHMYLHTHTLTMKTRMHAMHTTNTHQEISQIYEFLIYRNADNKFVTETKVFLEDFEENNVVNRFQEKIKK